MATGFKCPKCNRCTKFLNIELILKENGKQQNINLEE